MAKKNTSNDTKRSARKPLSLWGKVICIIGCAVVVGLVLTGIRFFGNPSPTYASAQLQLTFDGAAEGKAPDGYAFSVDELTSDEVIGAALKASSLDGVYTPDQIRTGLVIAGSYPKDIVAQTMSYDSLLNFTASRTLTVDRFHPTLFNVVLYNHFDKTISRAKLEALLQNLLSAYQSYFASRYVQGTPADADKSTFELSDYDYPQQLQILQQRLELISSYATELYEREPSFKYAGNSFNDIVARISSLLDSDIGRLNADMTLNALTKDPERLSTQYQFELRDLSNQLVRRQKQLVDLDALIATYEKSEILYISTAESLTKIDGNSSETYDKLVDIRKGIAADNTATSSEISVYRLKLSDLYGEDVELVGDQLIAVTDEPEYVPVSVPDADGEGSAVTAEEPEANEAIPVSTAAKAESKTLILQTLSEETTTKKRQREAFETEVAALEEKCDAVAADFSAMVKAWNASKINDLSVSASTYKYVAPHLISGAFIKTAIKTTGPIVAVAVIVCLCMIIVTKKREETVV